jgi:hypothetical protein
MSINDRFSKDGNSPILLDKYKDFSSSKLSEMLYLTDEQLEKVSETTTVVEIREIRKPVEVVSTSKQEEILKNYYECTEYKLHQYSTGCTECNYDKADCPYDRKGYFEKIKQQEEWSIHCEVLKEMCNSLCKMQSYILEKNNYSMETIKSVSRDSQTFSFGFGDDGSGHSKYDGICKNERYHVAEFHGSGKWIFEAVEVDQHIWNFNGRDWHNNHPRMTIDELDLSVSAYNALRKHDIGTVDGLCEHTEKELLEDWKVGSFYTKQIIEKLSSIGRSLKPDINESVETEPEYIEPVTEDEDDADEVPCRSCKYDTMNPDEYLKDHPGATLPCIACDDKFESWRPNDFEEETKTEGKRMRDPDLSCKYDPDARCLIASKESCKRSSDDGCMNCSGGWGDDDYITVETTEKEPDPVETVEADIIQTVPEEPFTDQCEASGLKFNNWLKANGSSIADIVSIVLYDKKIPDKDNLHAQIQNSLISRLISKTEAYYSYLTSELGIEPERPKQVQPELPILKNNDQRKDWAENYKAWGEWYYDEHIDCHYYKYDFLSGDRLVVEEYRGREVYWKDGQHDECHYHLLHKAKQSYGNKRTYEEKYTHHESSMTEIVEFLKCIQKK